MTTLFSENLSTVGKVKVDGPDNRRDLTAFEIVHNGPFILPAGLFTPEERKGNFSLSLWRV